MKSRWLPPSRPDHVPCVTTAGLQPSGIVPNCPLPHESVLALFQLMLICAILPDFTPVTVPYCDLIKVWVSVTLPFGKSNGNGGIYPIGKILNPNAIKALNGRAILSSGTTVAIPFIHPSYLQRSVQVSIAPDGTVNLLVGPEVAVTGGIVEIHF